MKTLYNKITKKQFLISSVICLLCGDITFFSFIYYTLKDLKILKQVLIAETKFIDGMQVITTSPEFAHQFAQIALQVVIIMIILFFFLNITIYFFYYKQKRSPTEYILLLSWTAFIISLAFCALFIRVFPIYSTLFFLIAIMYLYIGLGFRHFKMGRNFMSKIKEQ